MPDAGSDFLRLFTHIADNLRGNEQLVAIQLLRHWSKSGEIFPGVALLAQKTGLHRTTVMRAIQGLEESGAVVVVRSNGRSNRYRLTGTAEPVAQSDRSDGATSRTERLDQSHRATRPVAQSDPKKPNKKSNKKPIVGASKKSPSWRFVPESWEPTEQHMQLASDLGVNLAAELAKFRDYEFKQAKTDANRAFNTWLRNASTFGGGNRPTGTPQRGMAAGGQTGRFDGGPIQPNSSLSTEELLASWGHGGGSA